jgi:hypothetical protein
MLAERLVRAAFALLVLTWVAGCSSQAASPTSAPATQPEASQPVGSCILGLPEGTSDNAAISALLAAEGDFMVKQDIDSLMRLWAEGGRVIDAKNTPQDDTDNQLWDGKDAIRHRYVRTVFPGNPDTAGPANLEITLDGDRATVISTTRIGSEVSPQGDRWTLLREGSCWLLESLTYNLEAAN